MSTVLKLEEISFTDGFWDYLKSKKITHGFRGYLWRILWLSGTNIGLRDASASKNWRRKIPPEENNSPRNSLHFFRPSHRFPASEPSSCTTWSLAEGDQKYLRLCQKYFYDHKEYFRLCQKHFYVHWEYLYQKYFTQNSLSF